MTAQIEDIYKLNGVKFNIVAMSAPLYFNPRDYGLEPHAICTACWSGYWCEYNISDDELYLQNLYIFNKDGNYPSLNGIDVSPISYYEVDSFYGGKRHKEKCETHGGHRVYENVNLPIPYTGCILVGEGFLPKYYVHMGYQRSWAYETLKELIFEEGILLDVVDHSKMAEEQRRQIDASENDPTCPGNIMKYVMESFSLDYADKAWWLK